MKHTIRRFVSIGDIEIGELIEGNEELLLLPEGERFLREIIRLI